MTCFESQLRICGDRCRALQCWGTIFAKNMSTSKWNDIGHSTYKNTSSVRWNKKNKYNFSISQYSPMGHDPSLCKNSSYHTRSIKKMPKKDIVYDPNYTFILITFSCLRYCLDSLTSLQ